MLNDILDQWHKQDLKRQIAERAAAERRKNWKVEQQKREAAHLRMLRQQVFDAPQTIFINLETREIHIVSTLRLVEDRYGRKVQNVIPQPPSHFGSMRDITAIHLLKGGNARAVEIMNELRFNESTWNKETFLTLMQKSAA